MPSLDDVYRKFGEASEAAQLLETELGNILIEIGVVEANFLDEPNPERASELFKKINRQTFGQLLKKVSNSTESVSHLEGLLSRALAERTVEKARALLTHDPVTKTERAGRKAHKMDILELE